MDLFYYYKQTKKTFCTERAVNKVKIFILFQDIPKPHQHVDYKDHQDLLIYSAIKKN